MLSALEFPILFFHPNLTPPLIYPFSPWTTPFPTVFHPSSMFENPPVGKNVEKTWQTWRNCLRRVLRFGFGRGDLAQPSEFLEWIVRWSLLGWVWDSQRWECGEANRAGIRRVGWVKGEVWLYIALPVLKVSSKISLHQQNYGWLGKRIDWFILFLFFWGMDGYLPGRWRFAVRVGGDVPKLFLFMFTRGKPGEMIPFDSTLIAPAKWAGPQKEGSSSNHIGISRGELLVLNWGCKPPTKVSCFLLKNQTWRGMVRYPSQTGS